MGRQEDEVIVRSETCGAHGTIVEMRNDHKGGFWVGEKIRGYNSVERRAPRSLTREEADGEFDKLVTLRNLQEYFFGERARWNYPRRGW